MGNLTFDKSSHNQTQKKTAPHIEEVKPAKPDQKYNVDEFNASLKKQREKATKQTPKRKRGRPRKNKVTKMIRISAEAVDMINAVKQATSASSQDEAIIKVIKGYTEGKQMPEGQSRFYNLLLEIKDDE